MTQRDALAAAVLIMKGDRRTYTNLDRSIYSNGTERLNFYIFGVEPDTEREGILASSENSWDHALTILKAKHGTWLTVPDPSADAEPQAAGDGHEDEAA